MSSISFREKAIRDKEATRNRVLVEIAAIEKAYPQYSLNAIWKLKKKRVEKLDKDISEYQKIVDDYNKSK